MAVIECEGRIVRECEGRIVRSEAAFKLRRAVTSQRDVQTIVLDLSKYLPSKAEV
jgi:hypothetical protein